MIVTSRGRFRLKFSHMVFPITCSRTMQPRTVNRWRQRLNTASKTISTIVAMVVSQKEKPLSTASAMSVSHGVRRRATCRRIAESSRSVKPPNAVELWARTAQSSNTPNATNHPVPVVPMCFGRGGGAPDGRRRRRVRVAVLGAGCCAPATGGGSAGSSRPRHRPSREPLILEPLPSDCAEIIGAVCHPGVQRSELGRRQPCGHRVDGIDEVRSPSIDELRAHQAV